MAQYIPPEQMAATLGNLGKMLSDGRFPAGTRGTYQRADEPNLSAVENVAIGARNLAERFGAPNPEQFYDLARLGGEMTPAVMEEDTRNASDEFRQGNILSGLGYSSLAALGLIPGAGPAAKKVAKGVKKLLPMDEASRMARARDIGFDVEDTLYHGTAEDFPEFSKLHSGKVTNAKSAKGVTWLTGSPETAGGYAELAAQKPVADLIRKSEHAERMGKWDESHNLMVEAEKLEAKGTQNESLMPLHIRGKMKEIDMDGAKYDPDDIYLAEILDDAKDEGFDGVRFNNFSDEAGYGNYNPTTHVAVFDPSKIRSIHAKFDPAKKKSGNLLAGVTGATAGTAAYMHPDDEGVR